MNDLDSRRLQLAIGKTVRMEGEISHGFGVTDRYGAAGARGVLIIDENTILIAENILINQQLLAVVAAELNQATAC